MATPLHAMIIHFPLALTFLLPLIMILTLFLVKKQLMKPMSWILVVFLQLVTVGTSYLALETGEKEEDVVEKVLDKKHIQTHEEKAEIMTGLIVVATVFSFISLFILKFQLIFQLVSLLVMFVACYFAYETGHHGGELVYIHGAPKAYINVQNDSSAPQGLLPTPGMNTSESEFPTNTEGNESENVDDNDYGDENALRSDDEDLGREEDGANGDDL